MNKIYDLAIVGGGIAGLSLASSILHAPQTRHLSIALIEANAFSKFDKDSPVSNRTSSLTPSSVRFLQASTAWDHIHHDRIQSYVDMHVYDGVSDQQIEFHESNSIATMIENFNLQSGLLKALDSTTLETHIAKVDGIERPSDSLFPEIRLSNDTKIKARLLVGADGGNSPVRQFAGIASRGWDYPHHGVVGTLTHASHNHHTTAHQRMLPSGPIAFLPLPNDKASMVWSIHPRYATLLKSLPASVTTKFINAAFRLSFVDLKYILSLSAPDDIEAELDWRLSLPSHSRHAPPQVTQVENVASFPLKFRHAETYHADRAVLIGDAAHTIHPLAGQGLNLALLDSASLFESIKDCVCVGGDIGFVGAQVTRDRYWANARTSGVVDKIHKLYAREESSVVGIRSLGSGVLDTLGFAKRAVMSAVG